MKKTGFTLAEVLITLAIIGVVATMTLPALMNNTQEQQAKTGLKKGINTLTEAAQTNSAIAGFDFSEIGNTAAVDSDAEGKQTLGGLLYSRAQVDTLISGKGTENDSTKAVDGTATNYVVFFRDGSAISFPAIVPTTYRQDGGDGLPKGFGAVYDYNGVKKPNLLSNCKGDVTMSLANTNHSDGGSYDNCSTKVNRVIKDQFSIRLRGGYAQPVGGAARWAYEN